jgi:Flp pilus assembly protein TadD
MVRAILRKTISISIIAAMITICAGCGTAAKQNPASQMATLQDGATTYAQVIAGMGEPYQDYGDQDGSRTVVYMLNLESIAANTHSPQTVTQVQNKLTLKFDPNGILVSHSSQPNSSPQLRSQ